MKNAKKTGRTVYETVIILSLIGVLLIVAINRFLKQARVAKETVLQGELVNIRTSLKLFRIINGRFPEDLSELTGKEYLETYSKNTIIKGKYLVTSAMDEDGNPLDPFGRKYGYNKDTGEIKCLTKGYEGW